jgi:AAA+ ATPase superfamily predicted ATPase
LQQIDAIRQRIQIPFNNLFTFQLFEPNKYDENHFIVHKKYCFMENPFSNYGKTISGKRFIGRISAIQAVKNRIFGEYYGNLAIMGLPRIGKSSLAQQAIMEYQNENPQRVILSTWINMGDFTNTALFFEEMVEAIHEQIVLLKEIDLKLIEALYNTIFEPERPFVKKQRFIFNYFSALQTNKIRVIFVLDEFDAVRNYFQVHDFQYLRKLSYNPNSAICLVTTSRRYLSDIELGAKPFTTSNFHQTFDNLYLGMYNEADLAEYWDKFFNSKVPISAEGKQKIYDFTGHHPFLLDLFNFNLFNELNLDNILQSVEDTKKKLNLTILTNYHLIFNLLKEENLHNKLLQMVVGPVFDIKTVDVERLERYELVYRANGGYRGFSNDFNDYLFRVQREVPIWDLWAETETRLRSIVDIWLQERYGEDWVPKFRKLSPAKELYVTKLEEIQQKEQKSFPDTFSQSLLEFTYPAELFDQFMRVEWKWFKPIFSNKEANEWKPIFDVLARIRNPLAHNKMTILKDYERNKAISYCQEIVNRIEAWERSRIS